MKKILICICTYNRNESLLNCLNSIKNIVSKNKFKIKILIVDNSVDFNFKNIINKFKKNFDLPILLFNEKKRGVVNARNLCLKKIRKFKPNYASFIDDDCTLDKYWLINILNILNKYNADIVTGPQKYVKKISDKKKINYTKYFEKIYNKKLVKVKWAATNNVFFKFKILKNNNLKFDHNLNKFGMGEDQLFFLQLYKLGHKIYWSKKIIVYEKYHNHRGSIEWLKLRSFRLGILGHYIDKKIHGTFYGLLINYIKTLFYINIVLMKILLLFIGKNNSRIDLINYFFRVKGKFLGPILFNKINFLK